MLTESEKIVMEIISKRHLVRRSELISLLSQEGNGANMATARSLIDRGLLGIITPLGEPSYIVTKEGSRILKSEV